MPAPLTARPICHRIRPQLLSDTGTVDSPTLPIRHRPVGSASTASAMGDVFVKRHEIGRTSVVDSHHSITFPGSPVSQVRSPKYQIVYTKNVVESDSHGRTGIAARKPPSVSGVNPKTGWDFHRWDSTFTPVNLALYWMGSTNLTARTTAANWVSRGAKSRKVTTLNSQIITGPKDYLVRTKIELPLQMIELGPHRTRGIDRRQTPRSEWA